MSNPLTAGYYQLPNGHWLKTSDGSGPYAFTGTIMQLVASGAGGGDAVSVSDGADANAGTTTDAVVAAGAAGTMSAKLRRLTTDIGTLIGVVPAARGQATMAGSLSVVTASDQLGSSTASLSSVASSATSVQLLAANSSRRRTMIVNDSASATLYVKFGTTASSSDYTFKLNPGDMYESPTQPVYTGRIDGIWSAAVGNARITEM